MKAYEFCDQEIPYKEEEIKDRLKNLENLGYEHYGTTVKFVGNVYEFETENGHVYIPEKEIKQSL